MQIIHTLHPAHLEKDCLLTIGAFDGIHRGHQHLLSQLITKARRNGCFSSVVSFSPHPRSVLRPGSQPGCLTTGKDRIALLRALGLDLLVLLNFTPRLAQTPARDFVYELRQGLRMRELWVGADFGLGRNREGNVEMLRCLAQEFSFRLHVVDPVYDNGKPISSTRIRALLARGEVVEAARLLGRCYALSGRVVSGAQRGKKLGFPTANLAPETGCLVPGNGVYAVWAWLGDVSNPAVANIGVRPTFDGEGRSIEVHLLDFEGDLYGREMRIEFVERLRGERRFSEPAALIAQIGADIARAREVLTDVRRKSLSSL